MNFKGIKNRKIVLLIVFTLLMIVLVQYNSKKNRFYRSIKGMWSVENFIYKDTLVLFMYYNNNLDFDVNGDGIPEIPVRNLYENTEKGWKIIDNDSDYLIKIFTNDRYLKDTFQVRIFEEDKLTKMELRSKNSYIKASKFQIFI
jgi:hypothetical protein